MIVMCKKCSKKINSDYAVQAMIFSNGQTFGSPVCNFFCSNQHFADWVNIYTKNSPKDIKNGSLHDAKITPLEPSLAEKNLAFKEDQSIEDTEVALAKELFGSGDVLDIKSVVKNIAKAENMLNLNQSLFVQKHLNPPETSANPGKKYHPMLIHKKKEFSASDKLRESMDIRLLQSNSLIHESIRHFNSNTTCPIQVLNIQPEINKTDMFPIEVANLLQQKTLYEELLASIGAESKVNFSTNPARLKIPFQYLDTDKNINVVGDLIVKMTSIHLKWMDEDEKKILLEFDDMTTKILNHDREKTTLEELHSEYPLVIKHGFQKKENYYYALLEKLNKEIMQQILDKKFVDIFADTNPTH